MPNTVFRYMGFTVYHPHNSKLYKAWGVDGIYKTQADMKAAIRATIRAGYKMPRTQKRLYGKYKKG